MKSDIYGGDIQAQSNIEVSGINHLEIDKYLIEGIDIISTSSSTTKSKWIDFSMRYI